MKRAKKILIVFSVFLVLISNAGYAFSTVYCEMTKNSDCECLIFGEENQTGNTIQISIESESCCKVEVISAVNSSDYESYKNNTFNIFISQILTVNQFQITNLLLSNFNGKEILGFYTLPVDFPVMYSSLLI